MFRNVIEEYLKKRTLLLMREIINEYMNEKLNRKEATYKLFFSISPHFIYRIFETEPMITDCYYSIKFLTGHGHSGDETTDFEMEYFRDCFNGIREYNFDEKIELVKKHLKTI